MLKNAAKQAPEKQNNDATAVLVFADGTVFFGRGLGAETEKTGEVCFNTSLTGYQEILTDPSYAGQMITFTFPHIGNVGTNNEDIETINVASCGAIIREDITEPSSWRASQHFDSWLKSHDLPAICGIDTRAMTRHIRDNGAPNGILCHRQDGQFDIDDLKAKAAAWPGLEGMDLAKEVSCTQTYHWDETSWDLKEGYGKQENPEYHVVAVDFGAKRNILRCLASAGCKVTVVPATASPEDIMNHNPDGVFLSNGPGDPAATGEYAVPTIQTLIEKDIPIFGICLGHQLTALALGAKTEKMHLGHRGANHPVKDQTTGKVEITSQNHGFKVIPESLPDTAEVTHISLFDGTNEGIRHKTKPVFSVQYHPEASPGPQDSHYLFKRFVDMIRENKAA
ncbi:MAG: glutamine-hydrolyzing carbamoyl-phosphate synthase small subunit [Pseudomonadota bacterium]